MRFIGRQFGTVCHQICGQRCVVGPGSVHWAAKDVSLQSWIMTNTTLSCWDVFVIVYKRSDLLTYLLTYTYARIYAYSAVCLSACLLMKCGHWTVLQYQEAIIFARLVNITVALRLQCCVRLSVVCLSSVTYVLWLNDASRAKVTIDSI